MSTKSTTTPDERGSIRWHRGGWELSTYDAAGKRHYGRVAARNERDRAARRRAIDALDALVRRVAKGTEGLTVGDALDRYWDRHHRDWAPITRRNYPSAVRRIRAAIGERPVADVDADAISSLHREWVDDGVKPTTVRLRWRKLGSALREVGWSPDGPVWLPRIEQRPLDDLLPDMGTVLAGIDRIEDAELRIAALIAAYTGARRGEITALRWRDVNLGDAGRPPSIRFIAGQSAGERRAGKTRERGHRTLLVDRRLVAELRAWHATVAERYLAVGLPLDSRSPVLPDPCDPARHWNADVVTHLWRRARREVGLDELRFHDLRHLHASALLAAGVPAVDVAARLGHTSTVMVLTLYGWAMPGHDVSIAGAFGRILDDAIGDA